MANTIIDKTYALFPNYNNRKIVSTLEESGAKVIRFPAIEAKIVENQLSYELPKNLKKFDWIIFTDVLTVDFFLEILEKNAIDLFDLDDIRVCAYGEIVSDRLRFVQLHADVVPNTINMESVLSALQNYINADELKDLKFLLLKHIESLTEIKKELSEKGAEVVELPVYQIRFPNENEIPKLKALLKGGAIDEFIFSSPTDFIALNYIFRNEPLSSIFSEITVSAIDNLLFHTIREQNLKPTGIFQTFKVDKV